jgi:glycosyltransferase involved in cell wall biosynthesis
MTVGLVHDYLLVMRGAERSFAAIAECWPQAPIYTLLYDELGTGGAFRGRAIHTSYLQRLRTRQSGFRRLLPMFPRAVEHLPVGSHDLVVSSSSAFAHGVRTRPDAVHVCYCYTPFRYAWVEEPRAIDETPRPARPLMRSALRRIRSWDLAASRRVSHYIAISQFARQRIQRIYGRKASVVHPPVEVSRFTPAGPEEFLLVVTELVRHKQADLALEAARRARRPLKVVGTGPELARLRNVYGSGAEFLGRISDSELATLYSHALALIVPNIEEFGLAAVEAQAAGRPVIAADAGGARETVIHGETGVLVPPGNLDALAQALRGTDFGRFSPDVIRAHALNFSTDVFKRRFVAEVERLAASPRYSGVASG